MAAIAPTKIRSLGPGWPRGVLWDLVDGDTCLPWGVGTGLVTMQVSGNFGTGSIALEGALDATTPVYEVVHDVEGVPVSGILDGHVARVQPGMALLRGVVAAGIVGVRIVMIQSA